MDNCIVFNESLKYGEDTLFVYEYSIQIAKDPKILEIIQGSPYYYRQRATSAMKTKKNSAKKLYVSSMITLSEIYKSYLNDDKLSDEIKKDTQSRVGMAVAGAMFATAMDKTMDKDEFLNTLKEKGLYPYKPLYFTLKWNTGFKHMVIEYMKFLFPFEWYYRLFCKLIKLIKRRG